MAVTISSGAADTRPTRYQEKGVWAEVETIEVSAAPQNDIYLVYKMPTGASVVGGSVEYDALGASTAILVGFYSANDGTAVDTARLLSNTATTSAGTTQYQGGASVSRANTSGADYWIGVKFNDTGAATGTIRVTTLFTAESTDQT